MSVWQPRQDGPRQQRPATPPQWRRDEQPQPVWRPDPQDSWPPQQPRYQPAVPQSRPSPAPPRSAAPRTVHRWPRYPAHLVRFVAVLPRSRRRRGHSVRQYVYLGTHPIALLITVCINAMIVGVVVSWLALVWSVWVMWAMLVTIGWLCQLAAAASRDRPSRRLRPGQLVSDAALANRRIPRKMART
jgi:hypothetical protein